MVAGHPVNRLAELLPWNWKQHGIILCESKYPTSWEGAFSVNILIDLDGTLTDPELGITSCIAHALQQLGAPVPTATALKKWIGPPLHKGFESLLGTSDEQEIERAISLYRERFADVGLYENTLYSDTLGTLDRLTTAGHRLFVATSKPTVYARRIVEHFGINRYLTQVYGSELSGERSDKTELLKYLLVAEKIAASNAVMVGDRYHDVVGARANAVTSIGVLWGYGDREELRQADHLVDSWAGLFDCICTLPMQSP